MYGLFTSIHGYPCYINATKSQEGKVSTVLINCCERIRANQIYSTVLDYIGICLYTIKRKTRTI